MATFRKISVPVALTTMQFDTYNDAINFASNGGLFKPTKPYKRMISTDTGFLPVWCVTLTASFQPGAKAEYIRLDS